MGWVSKLLDLCKRYGKPAKFAATSILGAVLPGSPAVVALVEQAFDTAVEKGKDQWEMKVDYRLEASAGDLDRLGDMLDLLQGDLQHVTAQVARLEQLPGVAHQVIETALVSDPRAQDAARRLEGMAARFERLEQQQQQLVAGQEEMLPLLRRAVGVCDYIDELRASGFSVEVFAELLRGFQAALRLLGQGKTAEAELALEAVSAARPMSVAATVALAAAQSVSHNFLLAEQTLSRAQRLKPDDLELTELHSRATSLSRRGETPPAADAPGSPGKRQPRAGDVLDGWTLETLLGHGGWGLVFKAARDGRVRALKIMHAELSAAPLFVERFKREIITLAKLGKHPHLVEIDSFGYATGQGCWYFVMEWLDGITLEQHLARHGALAWPAARELFLLLADGLAEAHQRGIVHRDIKPANIMLRPDGRPVLVDFGLALEADTSMTRTGRSAGYTALFAAPEQIRKNQADARSDVYSLAASLYYALTYADPARREPHCFKPRFVPEAARDVLTRALDNDPAERPANATAFREALRDMARPLVADDFNALADSVRSAPPGGQILVRPGIYRGSLVLDRTVEIIGDGPASEIVLESDSGNCLTLRGGEPLVRGLTLRGKRGSGPAIEATQGRLTLEQCIVSSEASACISAAGPESQLVLARCTLRDARQQGLLLKGGASAAMEECEVVRTGGPGVEVQEGCSLALRQSRIHASEAAGLLLTARDVAVEDCDIAGNALSGIEVKSGGDPAVRRCRVHDNKKGGILVCERGAGLFEGCEVFGNGLAGVEIKEESKPVLRGCRIHTGRQGGLFVNERGRGLIESCDIIANGLANVEVKDEGDPVLKGCTIAEGRTSGLYVYAGGRGTFEDCDIRANHLQGVAVKQGGNPVLRNCRIHSGKECGVFVYEKGSGLFEGCDIFSNALANVEIKDGGHPILRRCKVRDGKVCGILVWVAAAGQAEDCEISGNTYAGVEIKQGGNPVILRCRVTGNGGSAFYIHEQGAGTVESCDLKGNKLGAWDVGAGCRVRRQGNVE